MIKVYVVGKDKQYKDFIYNSILEKNLNKCDIVLFTGGIDISPNIYGEMPYDKNNKYNPARDQYEINIFNEAVSKNKAIIGICRGAQLICALSGGKLVQDVENHTDINHFVVTSCQKMFKVTSDHHQMMYPFNLKPSKYELLAFSDEIRSSYHVKNNNCNFKPEEIQVEPEIVYFIESKALCIQSHPEWMNKKSEAVVYINNLIDEFLFTEKEDFLDLQIIK